MLILWSACPLWFTVGLFYLDLESTELEKCALLACEQFFALPPEVKQRMDISLSPHWRGYIGMGQENTQGKPDWREQVCVHFQYDIHGLLCESV